MIFMDKGETLYRTKRYYTANSINNFLSKLDNHTKMLSDGEDKHVLKRLTTSSDVLGDEFIFRFFEKYGSIPGSGLVGSDNVNIIGHITPGMYNKDRELGKFIKKKRYLMDEVSSKLGFNLLDIPEYLISDEGLGAYASAHDVADVIGTSIYTVTKNK